MILRTLWLIICGIIAYFLLNGMSWEAPLWLRSGLCIFVIFFSLTAFRKKIPKAANLIKPSLSERFVLLTSLGALLCFFTTIVLFVWHPLGAIAFRFEQTLQPKAAAERAQDQNQDIAGNWLWSDQKHRSLPKRSDLKPSNKPEVFLKMARLQDAEKLLKNKVYIRAFTLNDYKKGVWTLREEHSENRVANEQGWIRFAETSNSELLHEVLFDSEGSGKDTMIAIQGVRAVRVAQLQLVTEGMGFLVNPIELKKRSYLASSLPIKLEDIPKNFHSGTDQKIIGNTEFHKLCRRATGRGTLIEKLLNIQRFFQEEYQYSLSTKNSKNLEPLDNFLYSEKKGHCEFFATAAALMARELGLKTRVAYGWAGGEFFHKGRMFVFRGRNAHAWVEVRLKGIGWVIMEPTPPSGFGGASAKIAAKDAEIPPQEVSIVNAQNALEESTEISSSTQFLLVTIGLIILSTTAIYFQRFRKNNRKSQTSKLHSTDQPHYFQLWTQACRKIGHSFPPGKTLKQQLIEIDSPPPFAYDLSAYHYAKQYEGKETDSKLENKLSSRIRKWSQSKKSP